MKNPLEIWRNESLPRNREIASLQRGIDRLFDEVFGVPAARGEGAWTFSPPCDIEEDETHYAITFDLPGILKDNIKIELTDNELVVSGERKEERREEKKRTRHFVERYYGTFSRSFLLPSNVAIDKVEATYEDGELRITLPKSEEAKGRQIEIKEGKGKESVKVGKKEAA